MTPKLLLIGGPDVDQRVDLMTALHPAFRCVAVGSDPASAPPVESAGHAFRRYRLLRGFRPFSDLWAFVQLYRICRQERPQIVHTFDTKPSIVGRLAALAAGVPVVLGTLPGLGSLYTGRGATRRLQRYAYERGQSLVSRWSDMTVFQNEADRQECLSKGIVGAAKSVRIPGSGVHLGRFSPDRVPPGRRAALRRELNVAENAVLVTMVARLIRPKGVLEFAAAARDVAVTHPSAEFLLVGGVDQDSPDRLMAREVRQVESAVRWVGVRNDIDVVLATSDIFVLPTFLREGLPRVLLEAAAMGLPLVTTAMPGCAELVTDGVEGIVIPPRSRPRLATAIAKLVSDAGLRQQLGQAARRRVVGRFDLSTVADEVRALYERLLAMKQVPLDQTVTENGG